MIDKILKQLQPKVRGRIIYLSQYGSHLYGLNTENSDLDFRGVYIPTLDDIILGKAQDEINTELTVTMFLRQKKLTDRTFEESDYEWRDVEKKVDIKIFSLQKFIKLCSKADTNALDLLFSFNSDNFIEQYTYSITTKTKKEEPKSLWNNSVYIAKSYIPFWYILQYKDKLINTDRLESPITYAFKQATKYSIKGERRQVMLEVLKEAKRVLDALKDVTKPDVKTLLMDGYLGMDMKLPKMLDNKHLKIDELDNKGKKEKYLYVCGVQHQFNLELDKFIKRIEEKIDKEYTSQRTKDAADGNDWKALSHAIRVLLEIKELLDTGNITFPCKQSRFLLRIKQGKISREVIDEFFNTELSNILENVQANKLGWKYDEEFWNEFILNEVKNGNV